MRRDLMIPIAAVLCLLGACETAGADPGAPPPSPAGPVTATDRLYLGRLGEALVLSRAASEKLWPGWGLEKTSSGFHFRPRRRWPATSPPGPGRRRARPGAGRSRTPTARPLPPAENRAAILGTARRGIKEC